MNEKKNTDKVEGAVEGRAEVEGGLSAESASVGEEGALVEDTEHAGLTTGGVAPTDPRGHVTEGIATDPRERRPEDAASQEAPQEGAPSSD